MVLDLPPDDDGTAEVVPLKRQQGPKPKASTKRHAKTKAGKARGSCDPQPPPVTAPRVDLPSDDDGDIFGDLSTSIPKSKKPRSILCQPPAPSGPCHEPGQDLLDWDAPTLIAAAAGIPCQEVMPFEDLRKLMSKPLATLEDTSRCDLWEVYSCPRMGPMMRSLGGRSTRSYDLQHYWNFNWESYQRLMLQDVSLCRPKFVMLSPPCTWVCSLMHSNWSRIPAAKRMLNLTQACHHLDLSMWVAELQDDNNDFFGFEHPFGSLAWNRTCVTWLNQYWSPKCMLIFRMTKT